MSDEYEPDFCVCDYRPRRKCSVHPKGEQPAQGEPRIDKQTLVNEKGKVVYRPAGAGEGISAEHDTLNDQPFYELMQAYRHTRVEKQKETICAFEDVQRFIRAYAALKVRETASGREQLARASAQESFNRANRLEAELAKLREERDALKDENQLAWNTCDEAETKLSRAESALAEARNKALDEAAELVCKQAADLLKEADSLPFDGLLAMSIRKQANRLTSAGSALLALKGKRS